ncbi:MAG: A/G-specific adenine glycosylase [Acidobacteria bacterium]|nr:MAG: A/G-specific adenine glycosylase [Acidobacteriota bacterium]
MVFSDRSRAAQARRSLLRWYQRRSRALPWRSSSAPYAVWLSEVMLQQTQIETVIPFYQRFLREFPTVEHLANAPLERVLELWSGLGYYRRARNLHRAAQELVEKYKGRFPREVALARSLPGVGDYTAKAVLSIAYNRPFAVLDGNVARVMARVLAVSGSLPQPEFRRTVQEELDLLLSRRSPGNFNQAMMELGQTVCLPQSPQCSLCPLKPWCKSFHSGNPEAFPDPKPRRQSEKWHMAVAILHKNQQVMLLRGLDDGLLDDLWNFPSALGKTGNEALKSLKVKLSASLAVVPSLKGPSYQLRHNITYRLIRVQVYKGHFRGETPMDGFRWFHPRSIARGAVSELARKIAREMNNTASRQQDKL